MKRLKSILKWLAIIFVILFIVGFIAVKMMSESRPSTNQTPEADQLAQDMLTAMNKPAWDSLRYLKWEFMRGHKYLWDKQENNAYVEWDDIAVALDLDAVDGFAMKDGKVVEGDDARSLIENAWTIWCNDSFWMFAPFKAFDPGTSRTIVKDEDGNDQLMVSYESGGVTPGDAYLWQLGADNIPTGYKMWTFLPIKGMEMSWENWKTLKGGAKVAISHKSSMLSFDMKDVQEGDSPSELGYSDNVFDGL